MTETTARVRWEDSRNGPGDPAFIGHLGSLDDLFRIWPPDEPGDEWLLNTCLPGMAEKECYGFPDDLQLEAEHWLTQFVTSLGAIFPAGLREDVSTERDGHLRQAGEGGDCPHAWKPETSCGAALALDWVLAALDRMTGAKADSSDEPETNPAPAGEKE
jgi:hypothetical protein